MVQKSTMSNSNCSFTHYLLYFTAVIGTPILLPMLVDTFAIGVVIFQLCRSGLKLDSDLIVHIRRSLKKAAPLLAFVVIHQLAVVFTLIYISILVKDDSRSHQCNENIQNFIHFGCFHFHSFCPPVPTSHSASIKD